MAHIAIFQAGAQVAEHELSAATLRLGRHPDNDIVLADRTLSRFHARIEHQGAGHVVVDLGAQNGVWLNGVRIEGTQPLADGDRLHFGNYEALVIAPVQVPDAFDDGLDLGAIEGFEDDDATRAEFAPELRAAAAHAESVLSQSDVLSALELDSDDLEPLSLDGPPSVREGASLVSELSGARSAGPGPDAGLFDDDTERLAGERPSENAPSESTGLSLLFEDSSGEGTATDVGFDVDLEERTAIERPERGALVLLYGGMEVERFEVTEEPMTIGRSRRCEIEIGLLGLSRRHSRIEVQGGTVDIVDLGSQNGTWVNNERIDGRRTLSAGDLVNYYEYGLLYVADPEAQLAHDGQDFSGFTGEPARDPGASGGLMADSVADQAAAYRALVRDVEPAADDMRFDEEDATNFDPPHRADETDVSNTAAVRPAAGVRPEDNVFTHRKPEEPTRVSVPLESASGPLSSAFSLSKFDQGLDGLGDSLFDGDIEGPDASAPLPSNVLRDDEIRSFESEMTASSHQARSPKVLTELHGEGWPTDAELALGLRQSESTHFARVDVFLDGQLYTQMPLSQPVVRVGTDPRCELALPGSSGLQPWHATIVALPAAALCVKASAHGDVQRAGTSVGQAVLVDGDIIQMGRVRLAYRG